MAGDDHGAGLKVPAELPYVLPNDELAQIVAKAQASWLAHDLRHLRAQRKRKVKKL